VPSWGQAVKGDECFADRGLQAAGEAAVVPRGMTIQKIARHVAQEEGLELGRMRGRSRHREVSRARLMVAWVGREVGRIPVAQAARFFGRDTSVMINGLNRLEAAMGEDRSLRGRLGALREAIGKPRQNNTIRKD
jgi:chromosomal replication initiation ATPase DnaA